MRTPDDVTTTENPRPPLGPCPICTRNDFRTRFHQFGHRFERCRSCGFVRMADPLPPAELDTFYADDRMHGEVVWQEHDKFLATFDRLVGRIEQHVRKGRLLDVGCSYGNSLLAARTRGWEVYGVEPSRAAAEYGIKQYGLDIRTVPLAEAGFAPASFDAVLMHHTLEHLVEPHVVLAQVRELLVPGGVLYEVLPNYDCLKRRLLGSCWGYGITKEHVVHFSPRTLRRLLRRLDFEILRSFTHSFREDPRLIYDLLRRFRLVDRFMAARGKPGMPFDGAEYLRFLGEKRWARWMCNRLWPTRLVAGMGLGEEIHVLARRPG